MFMAKSELKNELKNAWSLTRIKLNNRKLNFIYFLALMLALLLADMTTTLISLLKSIEGVAEYNGQDNSILYMAVLILAVIYMTCTYRQTNEKYAVYPQTNTGRFLSAQAVYHIWMVIVAASILIIYLIQYAVYAIIASICKNVILVYRFDIGFVVAGFFVLIIYTAIIISIITLFAVLVRKFRIYAIVCFGIILTVVFTNMEKAFKVFETIFGFLIFEKSPVVFIIKGIILWAVLFLLSVIINKYTIYYKNSGNMMKYAVIGVAAATIVATSINIVLLNGTVSNGSHTVEKVPAVQGQETEENSAEENQEELNRMNRIVIDTSNVTVGSKIDIVTSNIDLQVDNDKYSNMNMIMFYEIGEFEKFYGNNIVIEYCYPHYMYNNYVISEYANPELTAYLEGNTLYLDYSYDKNTKAVFIPVWSFMWQFDVYKGKDIFKEFIGTTSGGDSVGEIYIKVN